MSLQDIQNLIAEPLKAPLRLPMKLSHQNQEWVEKSTLQTKEQIEAHTFPFNGIIIAVIIGYFLLCYKHFMTLRQKKNLPFPTQYLEIDQALRIALQNILLRKITSKTTPEILDYFKTCNLDSQLKHSLTQCFKKGDQI